MASNFTKELESLLKSRIKEEDLKYCKQHDSYIKKINDNCTISIGFGLASFRLPKHRFINPIVSFMLHDIMGLVLDFRDWHRYDINKDFVATYSVNIGYIMPCNTFIEYDVMEGADNTETINRMFSDIHKYAYPFFEEYSVFENLFDAIIDENRRVRVGILPFAKAVILYKGGLKKQAADFANEYSKHTDSPGIDKFVETLNRLASE